MKKPLKKYLIWGLFCIVSVVLLKLLFLETFTIPSSSMAPTLLGDPEKGDRVAVLKAGSRHFRKRFDLEIYSMMDSGNNGSGNSLNDVNFVKRLIAFSNEYVLIKNGDLFIGNDNGQDLSRPFIKSIDQLKSMLIPVYFAEFNNEFFSTWTTNENSCFKVQQDRLLCDTTTSPDNKDASLVFSPKRHLIFDDYIGSDGEMAKGENLVRDLALSFTVRLMEDRGIISGQLSEEGDKFWFILKSRGAGGGGEIRHDGIFNNKQEIRQEFVEKERFSGFEPDRDYLVSFMNIDDRILLFVDEELVLEYRYNGNSECYSSANDNRPSLRASRVKALFTSLRIDRDIYYTSDKGRFGVTEKWLVPEDGFYFLGDNSASSKDSRFYGEIGSDQIVGKVLMIYFPFNRLRFF